MKKNIYFIITALVIMLCHTQQAVSQSDYISGLNHNKYFRYEKAAYLSKNFHTIAKPYILSEITNYTAIDSAYKIQTNNGFLNGLMNNNLIESNKNDFKIVINPIISAIGSIAITQDKKSCKNQNAKAGVSFHADYKDKLSVHTDIFYGMTQLPFNFNRIYDSLGVVPHYGRYDKYDGTNFLFSSITGYISYSPTEYFNISAGKDKQFVGDGYRSVILSDHASSFSFLKATLNIWNIKYTSLFAIFNDAYNLPANQPFQTKYASIHYLSWNITSRINFNVYEAIVFNPIDSIGGNRGFDVNYLNPVIFFRPVEFSLGSPDNALIGFGTKIRIGKSCFLYGQIMFDEFIMSKLTAASNPWENKQAYQAGIKIFDLVPDLYIQAEYNTIRPFTYSHEYIGKNYGNAYQPLAHPLGANLKEYIGIVRYDKNRFTYSGKFIYTTYGIDITDMSYGGDIYKSYMTRISQSGQRDFGHVITQGLKTTVQYAEAGFAYLINHKMNLQFEINFIYRKQSNNRETFDDKFISFGIRTNLFNENYDY